jgi:glycosyltransferase involved in cell wall biosynthesis
MKSPEISIVMPVFNAANFLEATLRSILSQTFQDFELIIVDDGSTDKSREIVQSYSDDRIKLLTNDHNLGIVASRNKGCAAMSGRYYAPFDADDLAHPEKFQKQFDFLEQNPHIAMTGCRVKKIDEQGRPVGKPWRLKAKPEKIPAIMLFRNYFVHSSLLIRRDAIPKGFYKTGFDVVEDYMMCAQIAFNHRVFIYPEYLLNYRISQQSAMRKNSRRMILQDTKMYRWLFSLLQIELSETELNCLLALKGRQRSFNKEMLGILEILLVKMIKQNQKIRLVENHHLSATIKNRWIKAGFLTKNNLFTVAKKILASPILQL